MRKRVKNYKKMCLLLIIALLISANPPIDAHAAANQKIYSYTTKSTMSMDDTKISYVYNDKKITLTGIPGLLTSNNVALGPYVAIFRDTLGISTYYNKTKKTVTFKQNGTTLVLTLGSKTAVLNGKNVTMSAAPLSIKYNASGKLAIIVPTRFVAESFGYQYNWDSSKSTVTITKPLSLSYDNKVISYTGVRGFARLDGKNISVTNMPTLLFNNTAMVQAYRVFAKGLGATYSYNSTKKTVTIKKGSLTVKMTLGSTTATINGKSVSCGEAPKLIKNTETGVEVVMVPAMFTAKALGYDYSWNSTSKTSEIKTTSNVGEVSNIVINSGSSNSGSSSGNNSGSSTLQALTYLTWTLDSQFTDSYKAAYDSLTSQREWVSEETIPSLISDISIVEENSAYEEYEIKFSSPYNTISASDEENRINLSFDNTYCDADKLNIDSTLVKSINTTYDSVNLISNVLFTMNDSVVSYQVIPSEDKMSARVICYPNYLTLVESGRNEEGYQYVTFTGMKGLKPEITEDSKNVYVSIKGTVNGVGNRTFECLKVEEEGMLDYVDLSSPTNDSVYAIIKKPSSDITFETHEDGNKFTVYVGKMESVPVINDTPIQIQLPSGVSASKITDEDFYYKKQFVIRIPGDYRSHFTQYPITNTYNNVANIKVSYSNSQTVITVTTNLIQGYKYTIKNGILSLTVDSPSKIYDKIVLLDAGHGGVDPGAINGTAQEKVINYNVLNVYAKELFAKTGVKAYWTRWDDTKIALADRAAYASQVEADFFISVHCNSATSTSARGTSVYYSSTNKSKTTGGLTSKALATALVNSLSTSLGTKNLGIIDKGFVVVRDNTVPAVLIELAFLSNPEDKAKLVSATYQKKAAQTIVDTVESLFTTYPTKR